MKRHELLIKAALGTLAVLSSLHVDLEAVAELDLEESERQRLKDLMEHQRIICEKILNVNAKSLIIPSIYFKYFRFNRFLKSLNIYVLVKILIYSSVHCISFEILSK